MAGRYEVLRLLGEGGMGAVYEVLDRTTQRRRALKEMHQEALQDEGLRSRFRHEAVVASRIESEHVAETLDAGIDAATGRPFIVLELLVGSDLQQLLERSRTLPADLVVTYLRQLALALDKAHAAGVVHRDLKPENLFLTRRDDGTARIKVLDFGIAKVLEGTTRTGHETRGILGTPLYMAPEQVMNEPPSAQTDLYAVGLIAYTLLVGEAFWAPEDEQLGTYQLLLKLARGPRAVASERARARRQVILPRSFDAWFARATALIPDERFSWAGEQVDELAIALSNPGYETLPLGGLDGTLPTDSTAHQAILYASAALGAVPPSSEPDPYGATTGVDSGPPTTAAPGSPEPPTRPHIRSSEEPAPATRASAPHVVPVAPRPMVAVPTLVAGAPMPAASTATAVRAATADGTTLEGQRPRSAGGGRLLWTAVGVMAVLGVGIAVGLSLSGGSAPSSEASPTATALSAPATSQKALEPAGTSSPRAPALPSPPTTASALASTSAPTKTASPPGPPVRKPVLPRPASPPPPRPVAKPAPAPAPDPGGTIVPVVPDR